MHFCLTNFTNRTTFLVLGNGRSEYATIAADLTDKKFGEMPNEDLLEAAADVWLVESRCLPAFFWFTSVETIFLPV